MPPLFVLAFDHRNSFRRAFLGLTGDETPADRARALGAKAIIWEGARRGAERLAADTTGRAGILVDLEYGHDIATAATAAGLTVAVPLERSGQAELAWDHPDPLLPVLETGARFAKILIRYNPTDDPAMNARQASRIVAVQDDLARRAPDTSLMLELLVPPTEVQVAAGAEHYDVQVRPGLTVDAVSELATCGVAPRLWKLEGLGSSAEYTAVADACRAAAPDSGCLVLGRGADHAAVVRWLRLAAPVAGFVGFAVGRTIWWDAVRAALTGAMSDSEAADAIAERYVGLAAEYLDAAAKREVAS